MSELKNDASAILDSALVQILETLRKEIPMKRSIFTAALYVGHMFFFATPSLAGCGDHWTIDPYDTNAKNFCYGVDAANKVGMIPVLKKPKCPRNGPSSKCNPSSITLPQDDFGGVVTFRADGSYSMVVLEEYDDGTSGNLMNMAKSILDDQSYDSSGLITSSSGEWKMTDIRAMKNDENFQYALKNALPWAEDALRRGDNIVFYVQED